jgi:predicted SPOUT superfamily RNA methylase MTH1
MIKNKPKLAIAIPQSLFSETPHIREKTMRLGFISRCFSIFKVDEIIIYRDRNGYLSNALFLSKILNYLNTAPYLRKIIYPLKKDLKYVGILPPLCISHHLVSSDRIQEGEIREGVVLSYRGNKAIVEIGLKKPVIIEINKKLPIRKKLLFKVKFINNKLELKLVDRSKLENYYGYTVKVTNNSLLEVFRNFKGLKIATSKHGTSIVKVYSTLLNDLKNIDSILLAFGSHFEGLYEICSREGVNLDDVADYVINFVPNQGTQTIRTEEALYIVLSILNLIINLREKAKHDIDLIQNL